MHLPPVRSSKIEGKDNNWEKLHKNCLAGWGGMAPALARAPRSYDRAHCRTTRSKARLVSKSTVSIVFNKSFWYSTSWYTLWLLNCDSYLQHLHHPFDFAHAEFNKHVEHVKPSYKLHTFSCFDIWHFKIRNSFSGSGKDSRWIDIFKKMLKGSPLLPSHHFSLIHYFTARSLFLLICTDREAGTG